MDPSLSNSMPMDLQTEDSSPCMHRLSSLFCLTSVCSDCLHSCSLWCQHCRPAVALSSHSGRNLYLCIRLFNLNVWYMTTHMYVSKHYTRIFLLVPKVGIWMRMSTKFSVIPHKARKPRTYVVFETHWTWTFLMGPKNGGQTFMRCHI